MFADLEGITVESMIRQGRDIVLEAVATHHPIAMLSAYSGGNDSIVSTHFGATEFLTQVLHCNTGIGLRRTTDHVRSTCSRFGWDLVEEVACPGGPSDTIKTEGLPSGIEWVDAETAYEEFCLNFGFPGPGQHPRMYQRLKERSIKRYMRKLKEGTPRGTKVVIISGIRHDESSVRAGYKRAIQVDPGNSAAVWVNPFYWRTAIEFEAYRQEFGLPRNPVKDRVGISGECFCGTFKESEAERIAIRPVEPEFADYLDDLEKRVHQRGFPWNWGQRRPKFYEDACHGQGFLFDPSEVEFMPMCVGCAKRKP